MSEMRSNIPLSRVLQAIMKEEDMCKLDDSIMRQAPAGFDRGGSIVL